MNNRPKIAIIPRPIDHVLDVVGAASILLMVVYGALHYADLPDSIPTKFGVDGSPTQWSPKPVIWLLPLIGFKVWVGIYWINKYPHIFNYLKPITPENAHYQYQISTRFMRYLNTGIAVMFAYLFINSIQTGLGHQQGISVWLLPVFLVTLFGSIVVYLFNASK